MIILSLQKERFTVKTFHSKQMDRLRSPSSHRPIVSNSHSIATHGPILCGDLLLFNYSERSVNTRQYWNNRREPVLVGWAVAKERRCRRWPTEPIRNELKKLMCIRVSVCLSGCVWINTLEQLLRMDCRPDPSGSEGAPAVLSRAPTPRQASCSGR